jgi:hypothetical protein
VLFLGIGAAKMNIDLGNEAKYTDQEDEEDMHPVGRHDDGNPFSHHENRAHEDAVERKVI